jgi:CYTH domain-containing protein
MGRFVLDVYKGNLKGLITAEIELDRPSQQVTLPKGVECFEVTYDPRYKHRYLLQATSQDIAKLLAQRRRTSR